MLYNDEYKDIVYNLIKNLIWPNRKQFYVVVLYLYNACTYVIDTYEIVSIKL